MVLWAMSKKWESGVEQPLWLRFSFVQFVASTSQLIVP
jgi:hypothetical protein